MNCLAVEHDGQAVVIDCGVTFDNRHIGIDVVHPDFTALADVHVAGLFVTHGHEDHIGAIPYFLRRHDVPVFGPSYALGLVRERAQEHEILDHVTLREVKPRSKVAVGPFEVEPLRVTHSIADATALAIRTPAGTIVHTGDFKFDDAPTDGEAFDVERFAEIAGAEGVRLLLSDSTNVDAAGPTGSEQSVGDALERVVARAEHAVVVAIFASNVHRLRLLGEIARRHGRKLIALGRSVSTHSRVARSTSRSTGASAGQPYLEWPSDLVWPADRARELPRRAILAVATGTQGEEAAALAKLGRGEHPALDVGPGDVVVLSSRVIPGNEPGVMRVMGDLLRRGVDLQTWWSDRTLHVSGHAHREEQERMIALTRPRAFVPLHGTLHHLLRHASLARKLGVPEVCVLENGDTGELSRDELRKGPRFHAGRVHVFAKRALPPVVLHDREALAAHGAAHVTVLFDEHKQVVRGVSLVTRGVVDAALDGHLLAAARNEARAAVEELADGVGRERLALEEPAIAEAARQGVRRALGRVLGFKPVTTVTVLGVHEVGNFA
jgi:ribonuclease J